jgi:hypothetical protein
MPASLHPRRCQPQAAPAKLSTIPLGEIHMNRIAGAAAIAALLFNVAASAAGKEDGKDEGKICTMEKVVGSHMPKRVCTTAAEREAMRKGGQETMSRMKGFGRTSGTGSTN